MSFSSISSTSDALTTNRLNRIQTAVRALQFSTKEDYVVALTSMVNAVLGIDYEMQPLVPISGETPAIVGDVTGNFTLLNQDASDLAAEIERLEDNASVLYNLTAATQNSIRQQVREQIYKNSSSSFVEEFINGNNIGSLTASVDYNAGIAQLALIAETPQIPQVSVGSNSVGSSTDPVSNLIDGNVETAFFWNGNLLELILSFTTPTICNRLTVDPDQYLGYEITSFTSSPDGSVYEDILADLGVDSIVMDGTAGKFSGSVIIDFPPKSVSAIRLVFENHVDTSGITLRDFALTQRSYQSTGTLTSTAQTAPTGQVLFEVGQTSFSPYVSIAFQISSDSVHFTTIQPGVITLPPNWWYRAILTRSSSSFTNNSTPLLATTSDPAFSSGFTLVSSSSVPLSPTTVERTLVLSGVTGPIPLRDAPNPGTLQISTGNLYLTASQFSISSDNVVSFGQAYSAITLTYQTASQGAQDISSLQQFYTPFLSSLSFTQQ